MYSSSSDEAQHEIQTGQGTTIKGKRDKHYKKGYGPVLSSLKLGESTKLSATQRDKAETTKDGETHTDVIICGASTSWGASAAPWNMVMEALQELKSEVDKLKAEKAEKPGPDAKAPANKTRYVTPAMVRDNRMFSDSAASFTGFRSAASDCEEGELSADEQVSILKQAAKCFGPTDDVSEDIEPQVADMVNYLFDNGMKEEDYKDILGDEITNRPNNCTALKPVECNAQIADAITKEAKKTDFKLKDVNVDINAADTILINSLTKLDKLAVEQHNAALAQEVGHLNGALALLGNASHKNNLVRRFLIKREINPKYTHLCSNKFPMTRFLFGDDISQSTKQIEEADKLKNKFTSRKLMPFWKSSVGRLGSRFRGAWGKAPYRSFQTRFQPYAARRQERRRDQRYPQTRVDSEPKNSRSRGQNPRN